ncbi:MAG TPA: hypothetical protein VF816_16125 [Rhodocyclaceae bacterium]
MTVRKAPAWLLAGTLAAALAGCGSTDTASLVIDGPDTALTLERTRDFAWSSDWQLQLVVRRFPDCQRRHNLASTAAATLKVELFSPAPGAFILKQGKRWYVTDLKTCDLQAFKEPPPEPGTPVGAFVERDGELRFVKAPAAPGTPSVPGAPVPQQASS